MYLCEKCLVTGDTRYDYHLQDHMADDYTKGLPCKCTVCGSQRIWIDDNIAPIITTLWRKRIMTLGCCGGHSAIATPEEGMYHKLYIIFDYVHSRIPYDSLVDFCNEHSEAYMRFEPYNGIGLYLPSRTYGEHLSNITALLNFCESLPAMKIYEKPEPLTERDLTRFLRYYKFFYDIVVFDADDDRQLISFNLRGLYQFNIAMKPAFCPSKIDYDGMYDTGNKQLYADIKSIMEDYPIETLIMNPEMITKHDKNTVIQRIKSLGNSIVPENIWDNPKLEAEGVTKIKADS